MEKCILYHMFTPNFEGQLDEVIREYVQDVAAGMRLVCTDILNPIRNKFVEVIRRGGNIFAFGNGGSHAEADSFLYALEKEVGIEFKFNTFGGPTQAGIIDTPLITHIFDPILERRGRAGDIALLLSASGNSQNIEFASMLCRDKQIPTISFSANGSLIQHNSTSPDYPIVIPLTDQQKIEEVTLGSLLILARYVGRTLAGTPVSIDELREDYVEKLTCSVTETIPAAIVIRMAEDIVSAFKARRLVRIDAATGNMVATAEHMAHNLQWDARDGALEILPNLVRSGLLPCHLTGVGNDGGQWLNTAMEILENGILGDVEILLASSIDSISARGVVQAAGEKRVFTHVLCFNAKDDLASTGAAQIAAHLTGKTVNARILLEQEVLDPQKAKEWLRTHDLALLRKHEETSRRLGKTFSKCW